MPIDGYNSVLITNVHIRPENITILGLSLGF